ncbi:MAG: type 1 glutamine amidotransferase [Leptolinea sp.]|jgi:protease I|nr:type 1 glutamine amidotransferase [Leptolinea sp.]
MELDGMHILFLVGPGFEDLEFWVPLMRLQEAGADVIVAGITAGETYRGKNNLSATADIGFDDVDAGEYDGLVIPGGWAPDKIRRYESVKRFVADFYHQEKIIGMICHAGLVGISAGIVSGLDATGSEGIRDDMVNAGANWKNLPALRSRNVVFGRVVADIPDFCRELVQAFANKAQPAQGENTKK